MDDKKTMREVRTMEGQVEDAACKIKVVGIKLDNETEDKKQIVRMALDRMSKDVKKESQRKFEEAIKRTKLVVLGKGTTKVKMEDEWIATVPILPCCQSKGEKEEIERCLREAVYTINPVLLARQCGGFCTRSKRRG